MYVVIAIAQDADLATMFRTSEGIIHRHESYHEYDYRDMGHSPLTSQNFVWRSESRRRLDSSSRRIVKGHGTILRCSTGKVKVLFEIFIIGFSIRFDVISCSSVIILTLIKRPLGGLNK